MSYFNKVYPKYFIGSGAILESGHPKDLKAGQIALVDYKSNAIIATASATKAAHPLAYLAIGSYHKYDNIGGLNGGRKESDKTKGINPSYIRKWWKTTATAAQAHQVQVGWNGDLACTCPDIFQKGKTYNLLVEVKGSPVLRTMRRNMYKVFSVTTECPNACSDTCTDTATPKAIFDNWAKQVNTDPIYKFFVKATVVKSGNALPGDAVAYNVYTLTVQDDGTQQAYAAVQVAYPTLNITQLSRTGITSVYQVIKTSSAPANFGSTAWVDANYDVYKVTRKQCITLPEAVSTGVTDVTSFLGSTPNIVANSIQAYNNGTETSDGTYVGVVEVKQYSNNYVQLINDGISDATFDALPAYKGIAFNDCPCEADTDGTGCYALRLDGAYSDTQFEDCSFQFTDLYDPSPVLFSAQLVDEKSQICGVKGLSVTTLKQGKIQTGSGEEVLREYNIYRQYKQDGGFLEDPRMRQVFDNPILQVVDRRKQYIKYNLIHSVPRFDNPSGMFDNDQYLITVAFPVGTDTSAFEALLDSYVTSASTGVTLETK